MKTAYLFGAYLKSRIKVIAAFVLFMLVFALVYALYHLPLEPVVYSAELVTALAVIFAGLDWLQFYQKHRKRPSPLIRYKENDLVLDNQGNLNCSDVIHNGTAEHRSGFLRNGKAEVIALPGQPEYGRRRISPVQSQLQKFRRGLPLPLFDHLVDSDSGSCEQPIKSVFP